MYSVQETSAIDIAKTFGMTAKKYRRFENTEGKESFSLKSKEKPVQIREISYLIPWQSSFSVTA